MAKLTMERFIEEEEEERKRMEGYTIMYVGTNDDILREEIKEFWELLYDNLY